MAGRIRSRTGEDQQKGADRWRPHVAVFMVPVVFAVAVATVVAHLVARPHSGLALVAWWALPVAVPGVVYTVATRLARRATVPGRPLG